MIPPQEDDDKMIQEGVKGLFKNLGNQKASTAGRFTRTGTCCERPRCAADRHGCRGSGSYRCQ